MNFVKLFIILLLSTSFSNLYSQSGTLRLSGKVSDAENASPVVGASVTLKGGKKGTVTDAEGRFFIQLEPGKKNILDISYVGYSSKSISDVEASAISGSSLEILLDKNASGNLQGVVITTSVKKETVNALYSAQKNSSAVSDGISAEVIRKSPDRNTGEVLKRVSGASVQDNKFVIIRGLSERYNVSMLNNSVLPSTEADKKAFAFDIIPSSVVDNLVIYKSSTPDLPGDFAGGAIKVITKDYPAKKLSELSFSVSYNSMTTGKNFYKSYPNGSLDKLGFFDDSRLMPGPYYRHRIGFINSSDQFKTAVTKLFPNTYGYTPANTSLPSISVSYTGGNTSVLKNGNKLGYIYSVGYGNGRNAAEKERDDYVLTGNPWNQRYSYNTASYEEKNNLSALLNLTYSYGKSKISLKNLFNNNFVSSTGIRNGGILELGDPFYIKSANNEAFNTGLVNSVLEGVHKIGRSWNVDWNTSFGYTYKNQPDQRILGFISQQQGVDGDYALKLSNQNSPDILNAGRVYSFLGENIYGFSANATKQFTWLGQTQKLKFGTMNYYRDRNVEVEALGYATLNAYGISIPETKATTYHTIFTPENIDQYKLTVANIEASSTSYTGNALLNAGYLMFDNKFSERVKLTWGARVEKYNQELSAKGKNKKTYDNTDILPSLLFTYSLNNKTNIRIAGSQSVNRPEFRELADYRAYDYDNNFIILGNPDLERSKNTNADLRYEWFPASGEIISASLFYKYFDKPIEQINNSNDIFSYANADHSSVYGAEIEIRKKLDFIGGRFFDQLTFYTNATYLKGSIQIDTLKLNSPMQGQSPYLINGGLNYTSSNDGFSVNVLYNKIGPRLRFRGRSGGGLNIYEKPRDVVDLQVSKKILSNKMELKLTWSDLLAQPYKLYFKQNSNSSDIGYKSSEDKIAASNKFGSTLTLSLRYNFGK